MVVPVFGVSMARERTKIAFAAVMILMSLSSIQTQQLMLSYLFFILSVTITETCLEVNCNFEKGKREKYSWTLGRWPKTVEKKKQLSNVPAIKSINEPIYTTEGEERSQ